MPRFNSQIVTTQQQSKGTAIQSADLSVVPQGYKDEMSEPAQLSSLKQTMVKHKQTGKNIVWVTLEEGSVDGLSPIEIMATDNMRLPNHYLEDINRELQVQGIDVCSPSSTHYFQYGKVENHNGKLYMHWAGQTESTRHLNVQLPVTIHPVARREIKHQHEIGTLAGMSIFSDGIRLYRIVEWVGKLDIQLKNHMIPMIEYIRDTYVFTGSKELTFFALKDGIVMTPNEVVGTALYKFPVEDPLHPSVLIPILKRVCKEVTRVEYRGIIDLGDNNKCEMKGTRLIVNIEYPRVTTPKRIKPTCYNKVVDWMQERSPDLKAYVQKVACRANGMTSRSMYLKKNYLTRLVAQSDSAKSDLILKPLAELGIASIIKQVDLMKFMDIQGMSGGMNGIQPKDLIAPCLAIDEMTNADDKLTPKFEAGIKNTAHGISGRTLNESNVVIHVGDIFLASRQEQRRDDAHDEVLNREINLDGSKMRPLPDAGLSEILRDNSPEAVYNSLLHWYAEVYMEASQFTVEQYESIKFSRFERDMSDKEVAKKRPYLEALNVLNYAVSTYELFGETIPPGNEEARPAIDACADGKYANSVLLINKGIGKELPLRGVLLDDVKAILFDEFGISMGVTISAKSIATGKSRNAAAFVPLHKGIMTDSKDIVFDAQQEKLYNTIKGLSFDELLTPLKEGKLSVFLSSKNLTEVLISVLLKKYINTLTANGPIEIDDETELDTALEVFNATR